MDVLQHNMTGHLLSYNTRWESNGKSTLLTSAEGTLLSPREGILRNILSFPSWIRDETPKLNMFLGI